MTPQPLYTRTDLFIELFCGLEEGAIYRISDVRDLVPHQEFFEILQKLIDIKHGIAKFDKDDQMRGDKPYRLIQNYMPEIEIIDKDSFKIVYSPVYRCFTSVIKLAIYLDRHKAINDSIAVSVPPRFKTGGYRKGIGVHYQVNRNGDFYLLRTPIFAYINIILSNLLIWEKDIDKMFEPSPLSEGTGIEDDTLRSVAFLEKI